MHTRDKIAKRTDGWTDKRRETHNTTETVCTVPARAGNGINECPSVLACKHSHETQRDYELHTGGDDTSRTHQPVRHSQP